MSKLGEFASKIGKASAKKNPRKEAEGMWQKITGLKLTNTGKSILTGATVVGIGVEAASALTSANHVAKNGTVVADNLANTINVSRTPGIRGTLEQIDSSTENYNRFVKENVSRTQSGIDPNIVFAMHELRNG